MTLNYTLFLALLLLVLMDYGCHLTAICVTTQFDPYVYRVIITGETDMRIPVRRNPIPLLPIEAKDFGNIAFQVIEVTN